jgi:hypothetical protein
MNPIYNDQKNYYIASVDEVGAEQTPILLKKVSNVRYFNKFNALNAKGMQQEENDSDKVMRYLFVKCKKKINLMTEDEISAWLQVYRYQQQISSQVKGSSLRKSPDRQATINEQDYIEKTEYLKQRELLLNTSTVRYCLNDQKNKIQLSKDVKFRVLSELARWNLEIYLHLMNKRQSDDLKRALN